MTREAYLKALEEGLRRLPREEARKSISYYREMIDDRMEDGMTEEEAVAAMEAPDGAAERILYETPLKVLAQSRKENRAPRTTLTTVLLIVGSPVWLPVLCALLSVIVAVYAAIWAALASIIAGFAAVVVTGVLLAAYGVYAMTMSAAFGLGIMGAGLLSGGIGLLLIYPACMLAGATGKGTVWSLKRIFIGRRH